VVVVVVVTTGVVLAVFVHIAVVVVIVVVEGSGLVKVPLKMNGVVVSGSVVEVVGAEVTACVRGAKSSTVITQQVTCDIIEPRRCILAPNSD